MLVFSDLQTLATYYQMGGFVMLPLVALAILLWYALAYRWMNIRRARATPRRLLQKAKKNRLKTNTITARAMSLALDEAQRAHSARQLRSHLNEHFNEIKANINHYKTLVRSLVAVAPLLGLLGTVDGMIETFSALGDMALFSQTGGIAGGISRALFTTQMGLAISIPGLLLGRMIERRQMNIDRELDQIIDLVCAQK